MDPLGANSKRQLIANQIDQCESHAIHSIAQIDPTVLYVSAISGARLKGVKSWLQNYSWANNPESQQSQRHN